MTNRYVYRYVQYQLMNWNAQNKKRPGSNRTFKVAYEIIHIAFSIVICAFCEQPVYQGE